MDKILIIMPSMQGGGAERVISHLCHLWDLSKIELHLALIYKDSLIQYDLPKEVVIHRLSAKRVLSSFFVCRQLIKELNPNVVFSSISNVNALVLLLKVFMKGLRVVVRENNVVSINTEVDNFTFLRKLSYRYLYPKADVIICQSDQMRSDLEYTYPNLASKIKVIQNPVRLGSSIGANPYSNVAGPNIIVVGRLSYQKHCDHALQVFKNWLNDIPKAHLWFLGEGEDEHELKQLANDLQINDKVHFVGFVEDIQTWIKHADLFILCSRFEGTPNALLEALSLHCPVLVKAHPGGTKEVMEKFGQKDRYVDSIDQFKLDYLNQSKSAPSFEKIEDNSKRIASEYLESLLGSKS